MKFEDLEYLSLEGGGGKGAVYLGAIEALEMKFKDEYKDDAIGGKNAILDYLVSYNSLVPNNKPNTIIRGIAGASAGAITAFPLALGLSSSDIKTILDGYSFDSEFLPKNKLNVGKYRMVGCGKNGKSKILIAEDKWRKLGENKIKPFKFDFVKTEIDETPKTKEGSNFIKLQVRNTIVDFVIKLLLSGFKNIIPPLTNVLKKFKEKYKLTSSLKDDKDLQNKIIKSSIKGNPVINFTWLNLIDKMTNLMLSFQQKNIFNGNKILSNSVLGTIFNIIKQFIPSRIGGIIPRDNISTAISNIIWDRGVYAGFETREFFFKIILMSLSKDTYFRRKLMDNPVFLKELLIEKQDILDIEGCMKDFKIIENFKSADIIIKLSKTLPEALTFEKLFEITNINLSFCVTNGTTSQPLYFSNYFTPNYPVIEAVTSSMNFPVAFKPTYNEANVIKNNLYEDLPNGFISKPKGIINKEHFSILDYNKYLHILLKFINERCEIKFSLNGNLSFRSYLPFIRAVIANDDFYNTITNPRTFKKEEVRNNMMKALAVFYYNAAFKGLHMDGGITNNLPIAIHTFQKKDKDGEISYKELQNFEIKKKVLSLKLDNSFPQEFKDRIKNQIEKVTKFYNIKMEQFLNEINEKSSPLKTILELRTKKIIKEVFKSSPKTDKIILKKVIKELKSDYKKGKKEFTPWNKQVFIGSAVGDALMFGLDQGQIENIEDNENIIPLYCFGLSVLEFDLTSEDIKPLVNIANKTSKIAVEKYFE